MYRKWTVLFLAGMVLTAAARSAPHHYTFKAIAYAGDPAPGGGTFTAGGEVGSAFMNNWLNNNGVMLFSAGVTEPPGGQGTFMRRNGQITQILRSGQPAPGGGVFALTGARINGAVMTDGGDILLNADVDIAGGVYGGLYRYAPKTGTLSPILVPGVTPVPGADVNFVETFNYGTGINDRDSVVFAGLYPTTEGLFGYLGRGIGLFTASRHGTIRPAVMIGDPAPSGDTFDWFRCPWITNRGDVIFGAHESALPLPPEWLWLWEAWFLAPASGVYVKDGDTGQVRAIMTESNPYRYPWVGAANDRGDVLFLSLWLREDGMNMARTEAYLSSRGTTYPVCLYGDEMPGGGRVETVAAFVRDNWLNNRGDVVFSASLDTSTLGYYDPITDSGIPDEGLYLWSRGETRLVAKSGTVLRGIGTVAYLETLPIPIPPEWYLPRQMWDCWWPAPWSHINDCGQIAFQATLTDGRWVLLVATPK